MGSSSSRLVGPEGRAQATGLGDLPEGCVAAVLLYLDPPEICSVARLGRAFRGAAAADVVWESKLPRNYRALLEAAAAGGEDFSGFTKKEVYARLCRPCPFDGGTKQFWLERRSAGLCMAISSSAMAITGIDDRRYWKILPTEESRFRAVAYLQQIWWFEVNGEVEFQFPAGEYSLFFRLHLGRPSRRLGRRTYSPEHIHGWDIKPVRFQLSTSKGQQAQSKCYLEDPLPWIHHQVGDFIVESYDTTTKVKFSMTQIDCTHTKGGLCVDSVLIFPKGFKP